jgi:diacylglycerol kinase
MKLDALQWARVSATDWYQAKVFFQHASGFSMDALHVMIGAVLHLVVALIFRSSVGRWFPLLAVLVLELLNEASDFVVDIWPSASMQFGESAKDVMLTMFVPTLMFLVARYRPKLLR